MAVEERLDLDPGYLGCADADREREGGLGVRPCHRPAAATATGGVPESFDGIERHRLSGFSASRSAGMNRRSRCTVRYNHERGRDALHCSIPAHRVRPLHRLRILRPQPRSFRILRPQVLRFRILRGRMPCPNYDQYNRDQLSSNYHLTTDRLLS